MEEKKLQVAALKNGTVIDRLPADQVFKAVHLLRLESYTGMLTIGTNLESEHLGKKGIIKIADKYLSEADSNKIALLAPNARVNIIKDYEVIEKRDLHLPDEIREIVCCPNPKCITNHQPVPTRFHVISQGDQALLHCHYCEKELLRQNAEIK